ncbi:MAG: hypothetical protein AB7I52_01735 [Rhizobiaceae bacterium]
MQWKFRLAFAVAAVALLSVLALARGAYVSEQFFWRQVAASSKFAPRDSAFAFTFGDWLYLSNGYGSDGRPLRDLWRSRDGREWDIVSDATPYAPYAPILSVAGRLVAPLYDCWVSDDAERWEDRHRPAFRPQAARLCRRLQGWPHRPGYRPAVGLEIRLRLAATRQSAVRQALWR